MKQEVNESYCGIDIVIRNGKGVARKKGIGVLKKIESGSNDNIRKALICFIDEKFEEDWKSDGNFPSIDSKVLKGLRQLPAAFKQDITSRLKEYQNEWGQVAYISFGITGILAEGKAGAQPNYQIESEDSKKSFTSDYYGNACDVSEFNKNNITERFSPVRLEKAWSLNC